MINAYAAKAITVMIMEIFCPMIITTNAIAAPKNVDVKKLLLDIFAHNHVPANAPAMQKTS